MRLIVNVIAAQMNSSAAVAHAILVDAARASCWHRILVIRRRMRSHN